MILTLLTTALAADLTSINAPDSPLKLDLTAELGFIAPLAHRVKFGQDGTSLDYVKDGGQDNLFAATRFTAGARYKRQRFVLLYQPLDLNTTVSLDEPLIVDGVSFPAQRPIDLRYGFSFWRASWAHQVVDRSDLRVGLGLGLQIRNATIGFTATDGSLSETNRNIGPVPLLEFELAKRWDDGTFFETELDGFYAPIRFLNGGDVDVIGAIVDSQVRFGFALAGPTDAFAGVRYIGGGGSGTGNPDGRGDGYTENWLHLGLVTLGVRVR